MCIRDRSRRDAKENWTRSTNEADSSVVYRHKNDRGVLTTLSVPEFRKSIAGASLKGSSLSIELLFEDEIVAPFCKRVAMAGGGEVPKFKDSKKTEFAGKVASLPSDKFHAFAPLFDRLVEYATAGTSSV